MVSVRRRDPVGCAMGFRIVCIVSPFGLKLNPPESSLILAQTIPLAKCVFRH
jgi:hypothetical protein